MSLQINIEQNEILKYDHSFSTQFSKTSQRPQNFIKNVQASLRYNKYPRLGQLMQQKSSLIQKRNHPPVYIKSNLQQLSLQSLGKFDVILCDPPWQQYQKRAKKINKFQSKIQYYKSWKMDQLTKLKVSHLADTTAFLFLWVGSQHLEDGRELMKTWGFKRCEDIVWVKTNLKKRNITNSDDGIMVRVKEHCLMGYKGQPKKASSHNLVHPNIDIDVVITQQPQYGSLQKPEQIYDIIQRFCLGRKKIQLFGNMNNIRNGWLTVGSMISQSNFNQNQYNSWFREDLEKPNGYIGGRFMGSNPTIESLRPKEDPPIQNQNSNTKLPQDDGKRSLAKSDSSKT